MFGFFLDTLGSAKGWAASIICNKDLIKQFDHFAHGRKDTFSLGVCNGCQLMPLIGWITTDPDAIDYRNSSPEIALDHNKSER